jgi:FAD/FMN-containing dehydrogenase
MTTLASPLFLNLASLISGEIDCGSEGLYHASTDGSPYSVMPRAVVYPKNTHDIKQVIIFAKEYAMPITVRGGGTAATGGALGEGIILDLSRYFTSIRQPHIMEHTVTVDAGVKLSALAVYLREHGLEVPLIDEGDNQSTVGGLAATKSALPNSFRFGSIREWVEGVTVVLDTGEEHHIRDGITPSGRLLSIYQSLFPFLTEHSPLLRAAKPENTDDSTGYSLWSTSIGPRQLLDELIGSEGTLGIITSLTLRVSPLQSHRVISAVPIPDVSSLPKFVKKAVDSKSSSIFMYDRSYQGLLARFNTTGVENTEPSSYTLLVTHTSTDVEKAHHERATFLRSIGLAPDQAPTISETMYKKIAHYSFLHKLMDSYAGGSHIVATTCEGLIVAPDKYTSLIQDIDEYISHSGRMYTLTGYAGSGHLAVTALFDPKSPEYAQDLLVYETTIYSIVKKYHGGISSVGGDGMSRTPHLSSIYSENTCTVFKGLKEIWDPSSLFNPSKKTFLSTNYVQHHLRYNN